jgi:hypothetical protein
MGGASTGAPVVSISASTARDLSSYRYYAGKLDTNGKIDYFDSSAAANGACGIIDSKPAAEAGAPGDLAVLGRTRMIVDGTTPIAIGDHLGSNSAYKGVKVSGDDAFYFATALEASSADGDLIDVLLVGPGYISGAGDD